MDKWWEVQHEEVTPEEKKRYQIVWTKLKPDTEARMLTDLQEELEADADARHIHIFYKKMKGKL